MTLNIRLWTQLCLSLMLSASVLSACGKPEGTSPQSAISQPSAEKIGHSEAGHSMDSLPVEHRLAFMTGHVKAGLALYRAGEPQQAAPHLLHPVSETHQSERKGLDALGFEASLFETVSKALKQGRAASEIERQLLAAEANLDAVAQKAGGDAADIIAFLMDTIDEEYAIAITDGIVSDPGEYQDAFGFAHVARHHANSLTPNNRDAVLREIDALIALWPDAPIAPNAPTAVEKVKAKTSAVRALLSD